MAAKIVARSLAIEKSVDMVTLSDTHGCDGITSAIENNFSTSKMKWFEREMELQNNQIQRCKQNFYRQHRMLSS